VDGIITMIADQGMSQTLVDMCQEKGVPLIGESLTLHDDNDNLVGPAVELSASMCGGMCADWMFENYEALGLGAIADDLHLHAIRQLTDLIAVIIGEIRSQGEPATLQAAYRLPGAVGIQADLAVYTTGCIHQFFFSKLF
jgi:hypothetical protein